MRTRLAIVTNQKEELNILGEIHNKYIFQLTMPLNNKIMESSHSNFQKKKIVIKNQSLKNNLRGVQLTLENMELIKLLQAQILIRNIKLA